MSATRSSSTSSAASNSSHDVFISFRFSEASDEANTLKAVLEASHIRTYLCCTGVGEEIDADIANAIDGCKLAVIMGSKTYGKKTDVNFSTYEELKMIKGDKKPFFLVKMCDRFEEPNTRFLLPDSIAYFPWQPGAELPPTLVEKVIEKLSNIMTDTPAVGSPLDDRGLKPARVPRAAVNMSSSSTPPFCNVGKSTDNGIVACADDDMHGIGDQLQRMGLPRQPATLELCFPTKPDRSRPVIAKRKDMPVGAVPSPFAMAMANRESSSDRPPPPPPARRHDPKHPTAHDYTIAIDFGTIRSGASFTITHTDDRQMSDITPYFLGASKVGTERSDKVPTMLLCKLSADGSDFDELASHYLDPDCSDDTAEDERLGIGFTEYERVVVDDDLDSEAWFLASDFKMLLDIKTRQESGERVPRDLREQQVELRSLQDGRTIKKSLMTVTALYLRCVGDLARNAMLKHCEDNHLPVPDHDQIVWVVTVPAIWRDRARMFMREALVKCGFVSPEHQLNNVRICLEPEGAALFCFNEFIFKHNRTDVIDKDDKFIVVNLGSRTAEFTVNQVATFNVKYQQVEFEEVMPPSGGDWGGRVINQAFEERILLPMLGEAAQKYRSSKMRLSYLDQFEDIKQIFDGQKGSAFKYGELKSDLGLSASELQSNLPSDLSARGVEALRRFLQLPAPVMRELFGSVTDQICGHLRKLLREVSHVKAVFLVGGMGNNVYVHQVVKATVDEFAQVGLFKPAMSSTAIAMGATLFSRLPGAFGMRKARATYGLALHNRSNPVKRFFHVLVRKGATIEDQEPQLIFTVREDQRSASFEIYETDIDTDADMPRYIDDRRVTFVAEATIPVDMDVPFKDRGYDVTVSMDGPTITAKARRTADGKEVDVQWQSR